MPLFSIITASKNPGILLLDTFKSLQGQLYSDFEWILVDSSDEPTSISVIEDLRPYISVLIRKQDRSIPHAWNLGIEQSSGMFILILNCGDTYSSQFLLHCSIRCSTASILCAPMSIVSAKGSSLGIMKPKPRALWRGMTIPHEWMCVPRCFYKRFGLYKELIHAMDFEWVYRVYLSEGASSFTLLEGISFGSYCLGGHSHVNYREGLKATCSILQSQSKYSPVPMFLYYAYALKRILGSTSD